MGIFWQNFPPKWRTALGGVCSGRENKELPEKTAVSASRGPVLGRGAVVRVKETSMNSQGLRRALFVLIVVLVTAGSGRAQAASQGPYGFFAAPVYVNRVQSGYNMAPWYHGIAAGDFNGDGKLDFTLTDNATSWWVTDNRITRVSIFLGNGDGTFAMKAAYLFPSAELESLAVADLNGDGKLDLLISFRDATLHTELVLGNGDGTFQDPVPIPTCEKFAIADFNGDGKPDIACMNDNLTILLNDGSANFTTMEVPLQVTFPISEWRIISAADLDGDGNSDLVLSFETEVNSSHTTTLVLYGDGKGNFSSVNGAVLQTSLAYVFPTPNFDGSGRPSLAGTSTATFCFLRQTSPRQFDNANPVCLPALSEGMETQFPGSVYVTDLNGDGILDVVQGNRVFLQDSSGRFVYDQLVLNAPAVLGDFNQDGRVDIINVMQGAADTYGSDASFLPVYAWTAGVPLSRVVTIEATSKSGIVDHQVTFYATVSPMLPGGPVPTGTVKFDTLPAVTNIGAKPVVTLVDGRAEVAVDHYITTGAAAAATYSGDANYPPVKVDFQYTVLAGPPAPPSVVSVIPNSGSGATQPFAFRFHDPNGYTDISNIEVIFGSDLSAAHNCAVILEPLDTSGYFYFGGLSSDDGATWMSFGKYENGRWYTGYNPTLFVENSQCRNRFPLDAGSEDLRRDSRH